MPNRVFQTFKALELEEKILNGAAIISLIGVFLPWISGEWLGAEAESNYSGFGFFTSFLGLVTFFLLVILLAITVVPTLGGPVLIRKKHRDFVRLLLSSQAAVLVLASLSVLTRITFEFSRMHVRFGIYITLIGCIITSLYSFLRFHAYRSETAHGFFRHPEDTAEPPEKQEMMAPPPPPPPPAPPAVEDHRLFP